MIDTGFSFASLANKRQTKKVAFMGQQVEIRKLLVSEVLQIQEAGNPKVDPDSPVKEEDVGFNTLKLVLQLAVVGAESLDDDQFKAFPLDDLTTLSEMIMTYSGLDPKKGK